MTDTKNAEGTALTRGDQPFDGATLGATALDGGVNFGVASTVADGVTVCLFDSDGNETKARRRRNRLARTDCCFAWYADNTARPGAATAMRLVRAPALVRPDKVDYTCGPPSAALLF